MTGQTVDNLMPLLQILQQPAFCIRADGTVSCNRAAQLLAPSDLDALPQWLGPGMECLAGWDRQSTLELPVTQNGHKYMATLQPLDDGTLFLLSEDSDLSTADAALAVTAQVLRQPLTDLSVLVQRLSAHPDAENIQAQTASITRQIYRLSRITSNLADLSRFRSGKYRMQTKLIDVNTQLDTLMHEAQELCSQAGRRLEYAPLKNSVQLYADTILLERAIFNLLSNAIKFSTPDTPIRCWTEVSGNYVLFRVHNHCTEGSYELLRAAFTRLEQRDQLPDPRWGVGLGLPITHCIAQLHGGMVTIEADQKGSATVTMTLSRRRTLGRTLLESPPPFEYSGGMRRSLVELSDVLPSSLYQRHI